MKLQSKKLHDMLKSCGKITPAYVTCIVSGFTYMFCQSEVASFFMSFKRDPMEWVLLENNK